MNFNFRQKNEESRNANNEIKQILKNFFNAKEIIETVSGSEEDKIGIDYWVILQNKKRLAVDAKVREIDYLKKDVALETWSIIENKKVGWTLDSEKKTDYIIWFWKDTASWCLFPFQLLKKVFEDKKDEWRASYRHAIQKSDENSQEWHSECIFVPKEIIWQEITKQTNQTYFPETQKKLDGWQ